MALHPALIYYMTYYILPSTITCSITSCLDLLHAALHPLHVSRNLLHDPFLSNYMIHSYPITWSIPIQLHPLHAQSSCRGRRSNRCVASPARSARARSAVLFLLDSFCWIIFQRAAIGVRSLPYAEDVAASTRSLHSWIWEWQNHCRWRNIPRGDMTSKVKHKCQNWERRVGKKFSVKGKGKQNLTYPLREKC